MLSIASGLMGYLTRDMKWVTRIILIAGGLMMIYPETITDIIGIVILAAIILIQRAENAKDKKAASV